MKLFPFSKKQTTKSNSSSNPTSGEPLPIQELSPQVTENLRWRDALARRFSHRAVDIPDDMQINANKSGVGPLALIGVALAAGIPSAILAWHMFQSKPTTPPVKPQEWEYTIDIGLENGKWRTRVEDKNGKVVKELE